MTCDLQQVLNARDRIEHLRARAQEGGVQLLMLAPGETFEEDTVGVMWGWWWVS